MTPEELLPIGTWFISGLGFIPDEDGILVVLPDGRCVQFPSSVTRPKFNQTHRLWYSCPDATTIKFRMKPSGEEWLRFVQVSADGWTMIGEDERGRCDFPCKRASPDDLPDWFSEMMDKNLQMMATLEDKEIQAQSGPRE